MYGIEQVTALVRINALADLLQTTHEDTKRHPATGLRLGIQRGQSSPSSILICPHTPQRSVVKAIFDGKESCDQDFDASVAEFLFLHLVGGHSVSMLECLSLGSRDVRHARRSIRAGWAGTGFVVDVQYEDA